MKKRVISSRRGPVAHAEPIIRTKNCEIPEFSSEDEDGLYFLLYDKENKLYTISTHHAELTVSPISPEPISADYMGLSYFPKENLSQLLETLLEDDIDKIYLYTTKEEYTNDIQQFFSEPVSTMPDLSNAYVAVIINGVIYTVVNHPESAAISVEQTFAPLTENKNRGRGAIGTRTLWTSITDLWRSVEKNKDSTLCWGDTAEELIEDIAIELRT